MFDFSQVLINQLTDNGKTEFAAGGKYETSNNISPSALLKKRTLILYFTLHIGNFLKSFLFK